MKLIDNMRREICMVGTNQLNVLPVLEDAEAFDVTEIANQMIEKIIVIDGDIQAQHSEAGSQWINNVFRDSYIGVIPPFPKCLFQWTERTDEYKAVQSQVRLDPGETLNTPLESGLFTEVLSPNDLKRYCDLQSEAGDDTTDVTTGFTFSIINRYEVWGTRLNEFVNTGYLLTDEHGAIVSFNILRVSPIAGAKGSLPSGLCIALVAMMLLNLKIVKSNISPEVTKSRQQRRYEERHPERAQLAVRYHTLNLNPAYTTDDPHGEGHGLGGWEQAWHQVRGHLRRYKNGKVVYVRSHSKGNALKGIVLKDYDIAARTA